jgi:hypothetical protein
LKTCCNTNREGLAWEGHPCSSVVGQRLGVQGGPFFIINGKITLAGAQQPDAFLAAFGQAVGGK